MKRNIEIHDVRYMMTLKDMRKNICFRVYDYFGLDCMEMINNRLMNSEYNLDSTFLSYLNDPSIRIVSMRMECIDVLMFNLLLEIKLGMITSDFIGYNSRGIAKLLSYCGRPRETRRKKLNRYVIHYLNHRMPKRGG